MPRRPSWTPAGRMKNDAMLTGATLTNVDDLVSIGIR
jgi:hypothetical protein